jgi:serine/threonine-protein kinase
MALPSSHALVAELCRLELLEPAQAAAVAVLGQQLADPLEVARELLRRDWLTPYQANQLLQQQGDALLVGPYVLLERLGEGGMGQVFKARHRTLGRVVALKTIRKEALANPLAVPRFEREVQAAGQLTHPNVVRAFDAGQAAGTYYLAMEFMEGVDLAEMVRKSGPLPVPQACDYIRQAALGLQHAHETGFIHRDLKPANLFVTRKLSHSRAAGSGVVARPALAEYPWGVVKILDFGLARLQVPEARTNQGAITQLGSVMGTPDYLAPEQAWSSGEVDVRADLYSLGCTFYFLLTGGPPFPGGSLSEKLVKQCKEEPTPVEQARLERLCGTANIPPEARRSSAVPADVAMVVRKLMAKHPDHRYQTPAELAAVLASAATVIAARPQSSTKVRLPRLPAPTTGRFPVLPGQAADATIIVSRADAPEPPSTTTITTAAAPAARRQRTRGLLVYSGLLLCCTLSGRLLAPPPVTGETPAAASASLPTPRPLSARAAWEQLRGQVGRGPVEAGPVLAFRARFPGTTPAYRAGLLLADQPSPLDRLAANLGPRKARPGIEPAVVAVFGDRQNAAPGHLAFSADGRFLARVHADGSLRLWDCATLTELPPLTTPVPLCRLAWSPVGLRLAGGGRDGSVVVWDLATGRRHTTGRSHFAPVTGLAFHPDATLLASCAEDGLVKLWDAGDGHLLSTLEAGQGVKAWALAFAPDGGTLAVGHHDRKVRLWQLDGGQPAGLTYLAASPGTVRFLAFAPDGGTLVCGCDGAVLVCEWSCGCRLQGTLVEPAYLSLSPDGRTLAAADGSVLRLWDVATGQRLRQWNELRLPASGLAYAPDGRHLALAAGNGSTLLVRLPGVNAAKGP